MSISKILESMDRAGSAARREADEEAEIRAILRDEVARAGSQDKLAREWGISQHHLSRVLAGRRRPGPTVRDRLGVMRHKAERDVSRKLDKLHVAAVPRAEPSRPPQEWPYPLRPTVLEIFRAERKCRAYAGVLRRAIEAEGVDDGDGG